MIDLGNYKLFGNLIIPTIPGRKTTRKILNSARATWNKLGRRSTSGLSGSEAALSCGWLYSEGKIKRQHDVERDRREELDLRSVNLVPLSVPR